MREEKEHIEAIINGCKRGDRKSQELLYKNYYKAMISICLRYTKNESDAVEVLNNGFLKVFRHIERFDHAQGTIYTWLRTIVINCCLDFVKSQQRSEKHKELTESVEVNIEPEVIRKIKAAALLGLVRQLPPATMAVFNLYVIEGFSHKEIASALNISDGTSKWHLSEARKTLKKLIHQQDVEIYD